MKTRTAPIALVLAAATAFAQFAVTYRDNDGNLSALGPGGGAIRLVNDGGTKLTLQGLPGNRASIASKAQGLAIEAGTIVADITPGQSGKRSRLNSAEAKGGVEVTKDVASAAGRQTTNIQAEGANYAAGSTEGKLTFQGAVTIRSLDVAKRQTSVITGKDGVVTVDPDGTGENSIRTATLNGPVKVTVVREAVGSTQAPTNFVATGTKLVYNNLAKPATVTLSGDVKIVGSTASAFDVSGADKAVITLNDKGEMVEVELSGSPTKTAIRKAGGKD